MNATNEQVLNTPLEPDNDAGAATVRDYLIKLLTELWADPGDFSGKRPFGNSGWQYDLYVPLIREGVIPGILDEDDCVEDLDLNAADKLIVAAIRTLGGDRG